MEDNLSGGAISLDHFGDAFEAVPSPPSRPRYAQGPTAPQMYPVAGPRECLPSAKPSNSGQDPLDQRPCCSPPLRKWAQPLLSGKVQILVISRSPGHSQFVISLTVPGRWKLDKKCNRGSALRAAKWHNNARVQQTTDSFGYRCRRPAKFAPPWRSGQTLGLSGGNSCTRTKTTFVRPGLPSSRRGILLNTLTHDRHALLAWRLLPIGGNCGLPLEGMSKEMRP